jgi:hypothetical protein
MEQLAFPFSFVTSVAYISSIIITFLALIVLYSHIIISLAKRQKESMCQKEGKIKESSAYRIQKITFMMIILTMLYGMCYLPCLSVVCLRLDNPTFYNKLSKAGKAVFQFFLKSYLLCSALNPFVYCFCNNVFLEEFLSILKAVCPSNCRNQSRLHFEKHGSIFKVEKSNKLPSTNKAETIKNCKYV